MPNIPEAHGALVQPAYARRERDGAICDGGCAVSQDDCAAGAADGSLAPATLGNDGNGGAVPVRERKTSGSAG